MPGVFIKSISYDDWNGVCTCGKYPAGQVIRNVMDNNNNITANNSLIGCVNFGRLPKHHD